MQQSDEAAVTADVSRANTTSAAENIKSFVAGGFGGISAVIVGEHTSIDDKAHLRAQKHAGHPFDLTKTRLQTAPPRTYTGAVDVVKKTLARDGVTG